MSRYIFNPITNELQYSKPRGVEIPASAYRLNTGTVIIEGNKRTSPFMIALLITLIIVLILFAAYLLWLLFIKTENEGPSDVFSWIINN